MNSEKSTIRFGTFEVDFRSRELRNSGIKIRVQDQPFKVLAILLEHPGEVVTREELQRRIWPEESFGDFDHAVNVAVAKLRTSLGDSADNPRFIETLPRHGYRFITPVTDSGQIAQRPRFTTRSVWVAALASVTVIVLAAVGAWYLKKTPERARIPPSIAVLPFVDLSPEKDQEYFSDGLAEELLNSLTRIQGLHVAARTSAFQFKGKNEDLRLIGQKLNVATVLEGSVRKQGGRVRISAQLVQVSDGFHLWSEAYDRDLTDIFAVQENIARAVAGSLRVKLLGEELPVPRGTNVEAYNAYLQGKYFYARPTQKNIEKAIAYYEQAIKFDPNYAPAWAALSGARSYQAIFSVLTPGVYSRAHSLQREAAERALALDPNLAAAHAAMGTIKLYYDWDWAGADASYQRALALEPGNADVIRGAAELAATLNHFDEALQLDRRAVELDPLRAASHHDLALHAWWAGRLDEATTAIERALEVNPEYPWGHTVLSRVYLASSRFQEALAEAERDTIPAFRLQGLALAYQALGQKQESDRALAELIVNYQADGAFQIAEVYAFRGEADLAFKWLNRSYEQRDAGLPEMKGDPLLANLGRDPRYAAFLKKMRLLD